MTHGTENAKKVRILERALLVAARVKFGDGTATDAIRRAELVRSWRIEAMKYLEEEDRQKEKYGPIRPGETPLEFAQRHDWLASPSPVAVEGAEIKPAYIDCCRGAAPLHECYINCGGTKPNPQRTRDFAPQTVSTPMEEFLSVCECECDHPYCWSQKNPAPIEGTTQICECDHKEFYHTKGGRACSYSCCSCSQFKAKKWPFLYHCALCDAVYGSDVDVGDKIACACEWVAHWKRLDAPPVAKAAQTEEAEK